MSEMEDRLNSVLNNPQMMQQILSMAQSMGGQNQKEDSPQIIDSMPEIDLGMLQKISGLAGQSGIDKDQRSLLHALSPYLSQERINKLEKAMRAAKMARMATALMNSGALKL
jgi:hypothetical protein